MRSGGSRLILILPMDLIRLSRPGLRWHVEICNRGWGALDKTVGQIPHKAKNSLVYAHQPSAAKEILRLEGWSCWPAGEVGKPLGPATSSAVRPKALLWRPREESLGHLCKRVYMTNVPPI